MNLTREQTNRRRIRVRRVQFLAEQVYQWAIIRNAVGSLSDTANAVVQRRCDEATTLSREQGQDQ